MPHTPSIRGRLDRAVVTSSQSVWHRPDEPLHFWQIKNLPLGRCSVSFILLGGLSESAHGFGGKFQLHTAETLGLDVDLEGASGVALRMTDFVTGFGSPAGQITGSAHSGFLNSYRNQGIMKGLSWQEFSFLATKQKVNEAKKLS